MHSSPMTWSISSGRAIESLSTSTNMAGRARAPSIRSLLNNLSQHDQSRTLLSIQRSSPLCRNHHTALPGRFAPSVGCGLNGPRLTRSASARTTHPQNPRPASNPDRGPASKEDTQTDFNTLNVLGATSIPTTSIDMCNEDGFLLDSGLKITDGDGIMLVGGEAFVWRPWMATPAGQSGSQILNGFDMRKVGNGTGGLISARGLFEIPQVSWGLIELVWPKPDLIIIGTGEKICMLEKRTRETLQQLGVRIEVLDTRNAASQFNLLATERGTQEVAAAMVPVGFKSRNRSR